LKWREVINFWTAWQHYASRQAAWFMLRSLWFVSSRQQWSAPLAISSQLQLVSSVVHHGAVYFRAWHPVKYGSSWKCRRKFQHIFHERKSSQQTIHNLMTKLRTGLSIDEKQKHWRRMPTEQKLDDIGARIEHIPRKSLKHLAQETGVSKSSAITVT
jgi:hypothetical protein